MDVLSFYSINVAGLPAWDQQVNMVEEAITAANLDLFSLSKIVGSTLCTNTATYLLQYVYNKADEQLMTVNVTDICAIDRVRWIGGIALPLVNTGSIDSGDYICLRVNYRLTERWTRWIHSLHDDQSTNC